MSSSDHNTVRQAIADAKLAAECDDDLHAPPHSYGATWRRFDRRTGAAGNLPTDACSATASARSPLTSSAQGSSTPDLWFLSVIFSAVGEIVMTYSAPSICSERLRTLSSGVMNQASCITLPMHRCRCILESWHPEKNPPPPRP